MTHTYGIVDQTTHETVKNDLVRVERQPSETDAYFLPSGHYMVMTSNGESKCEGPVWILWDTSGYPYPITPEEFDRLYKRKVPQEVSNTDCPRCKGSGIELVPESGSSFGPNFANPGNRMREIACRLCGGDGKKRP